MLNILVIGSINMDLFINTDLVPQVGETVIGNTIDYLHGGKGANQAIAAARLGGNVKFIGVVGDDSNGLSAIDNFKESNVDVSCITIEKGVSTGVANVVSNSGDNSIIIIKGANDILDDKFIDDFEQQIVNCDFVLIQNEIPLSGVKRILELANQHNKKSIYNPAPFVPGSEELCKLATYCTPNELEARSIPDLDNLIITKGAEGVFYNSKLYPSRKVEVVDTTGAGDTFNGALCAALSFGASIEEAITLGIDASAIAITKRGAQTGMPYKEEIDEKVWND